MSYLIRPFETPNVKARQPRSMIQIAANNAAIPLPENWRERWCTLPADFQHIYEKIYNFEVRPSDVFLVTFMKCGTTWMQESAWLLLNNLDFETAKRESLEKRSMFMDISGLYQKMDADSVEICNNLPNPRLLKSHLPANLLPQQVWLKKQKIIYVARNVKDVVVSSYHFIKGLGTWTGNINEYVDDFMRNEIMYTSFWAHIVDFWKMRNEPFIFFVTYEEMKRDLAGVLQKLCIFLERPQLNEQELKQMVEHLSFEQMKANQSTNPSDKIKESTYMVVAKDFQFMRRGIVGSYKDELSRVMQAKLNAWSREFLAKHGIKEEDIFGKL